MTRIPEGRDLQLDHHPIPLWLLDGDGRVRTLLQPGCDKMYQPERLPAHFARLHITNQDTSLQALIRRASGKDGKRHASWLHFNALPAAGTLVTPLSAESAFSQHLQRALVLLALWRTSLRWACWPNFSSSALPNTDWPNCWLRG